jgi:hypothetical protein
MSTTALQSVTLQSAVLLQVKEFANAGRSFSVHNVTQEIRNKVNSGALEIPEAEVTGASFRFDIPHVKVKGLFDEMYRNGVFNPDFTLDRQFNGTFFEYTPTLVATTGTVTPAPVGTSVPAPVTPATPSYTVAAPVTTTASSPAGVSRSVAKDRIGQYLGNCRNRNFRPTLKQVQSAIKRGEVSTGWTCEQIQDIVENDLGFGLSSNPDVSAVQVIV